MASPTFPRIHAVVVCDEVQQRLGEAGVYDLIGVRTEIRAPVFPHVQPLFCVYAQVAGRQGVVSCRVEVVRSGSEEVGQEAPEQEVALEGPLTIIPVLWRIESCTFPQPGLYYIQVYFGSRLGSERLLVLSQGGDPGNGRETS
jgi:hypothetical protein